MRIEVSWRQPQRASPASRRAGWRRAAGAARAARRGWRRGTRSGDRGPRSGVGVMVIRARRCPLDQGLQAVIGHPADDPRGDPATAGQHQCGRDPGGRHGVAEIEGDECRWDRSGWDS